MRRVDTKPSVLGAGEGGQCRTAWPGKPFFGTLRFFSDYFLAVILGGGILENMASPPPPLLPPHSVFAGLCSCSRHISRGPAELGHIWQCKSGGQCQGRTVSAREGQWVPAHPSPQHTHKRQTTGERTQVRQAGSSEPWGPGWDLSSTWDRTKFKPSILGYPVQNTLGSSLY